MKEIWHKTLIYFGFADDVNNNEVEEDDDEVSDIFETPTMVRKIRRSETRRGSTAAGIDRGHHIKAVSNKRIDQARVHVIEPRNFNDGQRIAEKYKVDIPVILNLQRVEADLSKRIIDFVSGLTYALDGGIQKVGEKVFLLTPKDVNVSAEEKRRLQEKGFFNQL